jgi:hypothetical protein
LKADPPTTILMTAVDLATDFAKDSDATKKKYETNGLSGKIMIVTGDFIAAEKEQDGNDLIGVWIGAGDKKVFCSVDRTSETTKRLTALKPGQPLRLVGEFSESRSTDQKSPYLRGCRFATLK